MNDLTLSPLALTVIGSLMSGLVATIVSLYRQALKIQADRFSELVSHGQDRLADKDEQIKNLRDELLNSHDGARRILAEKEYLERMLERQMDLTRASLDEVKAMRELQRAS